MCKTTRSTNLTLIWYLEGVQKNLANRLNLPQSIISKMVRDELQIDDRQSRTIESAYEFPQGWLDRDNNAILSMPPVEYKIQQRVSRLSDESKIALLEFLASLPLAQ